MGSRNALSRFAGLSRKDRAIFVRAGSLLLAVRIGLWFLNPRVVQRLASQRRAANQEQAPNGGYSVEQIVWAVTRASSYIPGATCLTQAVAAQRLLTGSGHPSSIKIGVAKEEGVFKGHAWVICGGLVVLGGPEVGHFQSMLTWESK